ncbi:hypothetical protein DICSQDRAFT_54932, partial [Dichomitus squalens LYAD-421 SS1]|uniref:uncharacterized protein n=1 Tax=Dichomitus squalens (strain LYAD-421) TaxID=732165 RepID=UPI00044137CB
LDSLVNAGLRPWLLCYRKPIVAFYENDRISKSNLSSFQKVFSQFIIVTIEPDNRPCHPQGCIRCVLKPSPVCCSLCSPTHPLFAVLPSPSNQSSSAPTASSARASKVPSAPMDPQDVQLQAALHAFRREQTIKVYGQRRLNSNGPGAIMGDEVLRRVVDCARVHKLGTVEALARETKWSRAHELGDEVLRIVHR